MAKKQQLIVKEMSQFPAVIRKLWGRPPILPSEDPEIYWKLAFAMAQAVEPANAIEWQYLKDFIDYTWEIRELRKHKAEVIRVRQGWFLDGLKPEVRKKNEEKILEYQSTDTGETERFLECLPFLESIDERLKAAEDRRTAALRDLENFQARLATRLRKASDDAIIEAEYTETDPVSGAVGNERAQGSRRSGAA
jgi:hypothetical protein